MQIDWWTLALQIVNFLVLVWLLHRFMFQPVRRLIATRKAKLDEKLHAAEDKLAQAEAEKTHYAELIEAFDARKKADLKAFQKQLDADRDAALAKAQEEAAAMIAAAKEENAQNRRKAIAASRADLVELGKDIASKILANRAGDAKPASDLAAAMRKLDALPDQERQRLFRNVSDDAAGIVVVTAEALDKAGQSSIAKTLQKEFGGQVHVSFEVKPEILGGMRVILPQAQLDASWATYLDAAVERLLKGGHEHAV